VLFRSAGFIYAAALLALTVGERPLGTAVLAGVLATLGFLTRLNYLPLIVALVVLMLPLAEETRAITRVKELWRSLPRRHVAAYLSCIVIGVLVLMTRTWHFLGEFSLFAGTTRMHNATGLGLTFASLVSPQAWARAFESLAMIVTVQDPPGLNIRAALVIGGVACSALAILQAPGLRRLPLALVAFCLATLSGGLVARGVAYPGRFSLQLIPSAIAVITVAMAMAAHRKVGGTRPLGV